MSAPLGVCGFWRSAHTLDYHQTHKDAAVEWRALDAPVFPPGTCPACHDPHPVIGDEEGCLRRQVFRLTECLKSLEANVANYPGHMGVQRGDTRVLRDLRAALAGWVLETLS